jgi:hypothetical protein
MYPKLPIWLGAENEATVKLCAEIVLEPNAGRGRLIAKLPRK